MERVGALISRLQQQYEQKEADVSLIATTMMLLAELEHQQPADPSGKVTVVLPRQPVALNGTHLHQSEGDETKPQPAPEIQPQQPKPEIPAQPPIAPEEAPPEIPAQTPPEIVPVTPAKENNEQSGVLQQDEFNVLNDVPTLTQQQPKVVYELNDSVSKEEKSLNDTLKKNTNELASTLRDTPIHDLKKAIGINDRYLFINELFRGDETSYERSIKTINAFNILPEAEYWIQRELKYKLGWNDSSNTVKHFYQLVRRRFS